MKSITYFYLAGCPHCANADRLMEELLAENPDYKQLEIHRIDENKNPEYCDLMPYFYVPCFFVDGENRHEGKVTKEQLRQVLDLALEN